MRSVKKCIKYVLIFYVFIALLYWVLIRPAYMNWGATTAEVNMKIPGDELISANSIVSTRAINIQAPKELVWPWIAQTGQNRGGFNSYCWLENLFGAGMDNAGSIHPEWQNPQAGESVYYGGKTGVCSSFHCKTESILFTWRLDILPAVG
jgi:hypothetical protein